MGGKKQKHKTRFKFKKRKIKFLEPPLTVFLSSLINKMMPERDAADRAVHSILITRSWRFEHAPASSQEVEDSYLSKVRTCDIFVLILAYDYSDAVAREYQTVVEGGKPVLVFIDSGPKDDKQAAFIESLRFRHTSYSNLDELQGLVAVSIWEELIRSHRNAVKPSGVSVVIQEAPLNVRNLEDVAGYFIVGVDDEDMVNSLKFFGVTVPPQDLKELSSTLEPLYITNVADMHEALQAIKNAHIKSRDIIDDRQAAFLSALKREGAEIASHFIMRQRRTNIQPEAEIPGFDYYIWGLAPDFVRMVKLMRLEGLLREPVRVERKSTEVLFKSADHFVKVSEAITRSVERAQGNEGELFRNLILEAVLLEQEENNLT
jgi:hypothetical protein